MSSKRLPGKILQPINGIPTLGYLVRRLAAHVDLPIVIATSSESSDDDTARVARGHGIEVYRGSLQNVAHRFAGFLKRRQPSYFVRVNGDSPLLDGRIVQQALDLVKGQDIVTNVSPRSFPKGQSVEIINTSTFLKHLPGFDSEDAEHVTRFFYRNADRFSITNFQAAVDLTGINMCVDTPKDFQRISKTIQALGQRWEAADYLQITKVMEKIVRTP